MIKPLPSAQEHWVLGRVCPGFSSHPHCGVAETTSSNYRVISALSCLITPALRTSGSKLATYLLTKEQIRAEEASLSGLSWLLFVFGAFKD